LMADAGEKFDPAAYLPAVTGYYSTADGKMLSFPFNSSTPVVYWNKDAFKKAGLDPDKPPKTWPETFEAAKKLRAAGLPCGFTAAWVSWTQIENFSAWHNIPLATKANGLEGPDTVLEFNNPTVTRHIANLAEAQKDKSFDYGGRTTEPEIGEKAAGGGAALRLHRRLGELDTDREFQRLAQHPAGHQGQRPRSPRHGARIQQPDRHPPHRQSGRGAEGQELRLRRPHHRA